MRKTVVTTKGKDTPSSKRQRKLTDYKWWKSRMSWKMRMISLFFVSQFCSPPNLQKPTPTASGPHLEGGKSCGESCR
jgi:hypothetical protein